MALPSFNQQFKRISTNSLVLLKYNPVVLNQFAKSRATGLITCTGKNDGVGAQALAILSTMLYAQDSGLTYVHTPFNQIEHNANRDQSWEKNWENFLNLGKGEIYIDEIQNSGIEPFYLDSLLAIPLRAHQSKALYIVNNCHKYGNLFPDQYSNLINKIRSKYYASPKSQYKLHYLQGKVNIAVHIRRGDVSNHNSNAWRYTSNAFIYELLKKILKVLSESNLNASFTLYSQGKLDDFQELQDFPIDFHLDECPFTTFHNLVSADMLVMSKSTFSYTAALLSKGIKIYEPFMHRPLKDWIPTNKKTESFERLLRENLFHHQLHE